MQKIPWKFQYVFEAPEQYHVFHLFIELPLISGRVFFIVFDFEDLRTSSKAFPIPSGLNIECHRVYHIAWPSVAERCCHLPHLATLFSCFLKAHHETNMKQTQQRSEMVRLFHKFWSCLLMDAVSLAVFTAKITHGKWWQLRPSMT